jgi:dCMP deaminase
MSTDWHARWLDRARHISTWSKDPSTKVGCVLVRAGHAIAEGYNGFPHGVADDARLNDRALKYELTVHAEANAVAHAARHGHPTVGATAYSTLFPCPPCASLLIQAGVVALITPVVVPPGDCEWCTQDPVWVLATEVPLREVPAADQGAKRFHLVKQYTGGGYPLTVYRACRRLEDPATAERWSARLALSRNILQEAGVPYVER